MAAGALAASLLLPPLATAEPAQSEDLQREVAISDYTPLSSNLEMARRLLTPLTSAAIPKALARMGTGLSDQAIDLTQETFAVYAPAQQPSDGYGLLVFVPPWPETKLPKGWADVLDRFGLIFVTAAGSGNEANVLARREPLVMLAEQNIARRYRLNPRRVYIAGFSGGSRIAMRLALAYPDVFTGALLNAGADPIGDADIPLPLKDLFIRFQHATRLVYVTGDQDPARQPMDADSRASMRDWCVLNIRTEPMRGRGHEVADAGALERAIKTLDDPAAPVPPQEAACDERLDREVDQGLNAVETLITAGKHAEAKARLTDLDARFGGLAAPRSLDLAKTLDAGG